MPFTFINTTIGPTVLTVTILKSIFELTDVKLDRITVLVVIGRFSCAMHLVVLPISLIFIVLTLLHSISWGYIGLERSLKTATQLSSSISTIQADSQIRFFLISIIVFALIRKDQHTVAFFKSVTKNSFENSPIWKDFLSLALLYTCLPFSLEDPCALRVVIMAIPIGLVLVPLTLIIAAVAVYHVAKSLAIVIHPTANIVKSFLLVYHYSHSVTDTRYPA